MKYRLMKFARWFKRKPRQNNGLQDANYILTRFEDILYCTSDNGVKNVTTIVTKTRKVFDDRCLRSFEEIDFFCRISKTTIINLLKINSRNDWNVVYIDNKRFPVGRNYRENLKKEFEKILSTKIQLL
jgi:DNA-binding LytR/AlgR family response regulator